MLITMNALCLWATDNDNICIPSFFTNKREYKTRCHHGRPPEPLHLLYEAKQVLVPLIETTRFAANYILFGPNNLTRNNPIGQ